jgi:hypothetical protein
MRESKINIIRNASINFQYTGKTDGLILQQEITDWCRSFLNRSMDSILADYEQTDEVIVIDHIDLDTVLGTTEDWKTGLAEKIIDQLKEQIHSKIKSKGNDVSITSLPGKFSETLTYYLRTGILPWNSSIKSKDEFESELTGWVKTIPASLTKNFLDTLREEKPAERFASLLNQHDFKTFLSIISDIQPDKISILFKDVGIITGHFTGEMILQEKALKLYKKMILSSAGPGFSYDKIVLSIKEAIDETVTNYPGRIGNFNIEKISNTDISGIIREIQKNDQVRIKEKQEKKGSKPVEKENRGTIGDQSVTKLFKPHLKEENEETVARKRQTEEGKEEDITNPGLNKITTENKTSFSQDLAEGVFITNAGAVIIAPFLSALFTRTGLLFENSIADEAAALSLLHFCITGNTDPAEFELLLPKILLGIDPEKFIDIETVPGEMQLKETSEMLSSVIEYWEILKDTSIDGLRETFLRRNGKLSFLKDEWLLRVEQKPFDMLLQQLPWNISMIRLPWMKHLLKTEWIS